MQQTDNQKRDSRIRNLEFTIERLIERIEKLERSSLKRSNHG